MSLFSHLPSLFGNEKLQMHRRLLMTTLKSISVDLHMSGRKFSMQLSYLFPKNTVPLKLKTKMKKKPKNKTKQDRFKIRNELKNIHVKRSFAGVYASRDP